MVTMITHHADVVAVQQDLLQLGVVARVVADPVRVKLAVRFMRIIFRVRSWTYRTTQ